MEHSNRYIIIYSVVLVVVIAVALTVVAVQLKPAQEDNVRIEKMQNILKSVNIPIAEVPKNQIHDLYKKYIKSAIAVNNKGEVLMEDMEKVFSIELASELKKAPDQQQLPIFTAVLDKGDTAFIVPLKGKGLWGAIWGYISFKPDFNTIEGCIFDHKSETPGLGAEISEGWFQQPFFGKTIFDENDSLTSVHVLKGGAKPNDMHGVDAISGGTITSKAVEHMLFDNLVSYKAYFKKQK